MDDLLNIHVSDEEEDVVAKKADRTTQTEEAFQAVKRRYRVKIENGQISEALTLPLRPDASKQDIQQLLHAVEELYFFRRYRDAVSLIDTITSDGSSQVLDHDTRQLLVVYRQNGDPVIRQGVEEVELDLTDHVDVYGPSLVADLPEVCLKGS
ncbi:hypothetical protein CDD80_2787 [Ophiocordyceps camponoti-rufipedis]|uniref:Uncharacterized protein n=1 Tax=Ophiocordyceps camponoti-rufipedis TaxID=2004952 RepID=A0A2C5Z4Z1_9HYPO|nr:hypothetical protein CDD80_2787 [Ophiocordyceps camponoti-rufipedis]